MAKVSMISNPVGEINVTKGWILGSHRSRTYEGLETLDCDASVAAFGGLVSLNGLRSVDGSLDVSMSEVSSAEDLEYVKENLVLLYSPLSYLPALKRCKKVLCENVPVAPLLDKTTIVEYGTPGKKKWTASSVGYYMDLVEKVNDVPVEKLLLLKEEEPYLVHLIEARLKGIELISSL